MSTHHPKLSAYVPQQEGAGQHTVTGTSVQTTRGTHRVTVYGTQRRTHFLT